MVKTTLEKIKVGEPVDSRIESITEARTNPLAKPLTFKKKKPQRREMCFIFDCEREAQWHLISKGSKHTICRVHYCDKHVEVMKSQLSLSSRAKGTWEETCKRVYE